MKEEDKDSPFSGYHWKNKDSEIQKAEQQLLGFFHAKKGFSLEELLTSMALSKTEWEKMKKENMVFWMNNSQKEEVEEYFNQPAPLP